MDKYSVSEIDLGDNLKSVLYYAYGFETPNDVYGCWKQVDRHEGGITVRDPETGTYWINECSGYTPAKLASEYSKQDSDNASREAYESLQSELIADIHGTMMIAIQTIELDGEELASDSIGFAYHEDFVQSIEELTKEMAETHFDNNALCQEAMQATTDHISALQAAIPIIKTCSFPV